MTLKPIRLPEWTRAWRTPCRFKAAHGGRGAGAKTRSIATMLLLRAMNEPGARFLCAREYQASMQDSVYRVLTDEIARNFNGLFTIRRTEIQCVTGSLFSFAGIATDPRKVKGMEGYKYAWVEEAEAVSEESWRLLIPTIVRNDGAEIWVSFNPAYLDDPTCRRFHESNAIGQADTLVTALTWLDNPWFGRGMREEMEKDYERDPDMAAHVWGGEPIHTTAAQVLKGKWFIREFLPGVFWDGPYYGVDWGITDPTAAVRCWLWQDSVYIEHEVYASGADDIPALLARLPGLSAHTARADNSWPETIRHVQRAGFPHLTACKKWSGSVRDGVAWLRGRKEIVIHPRCVNIAREARLWSYKTNRGGDVLPDIMPGHDHTWDAVRYACEQHIRTRGHGRIENA